MEMKTFSDFITWVYPDQSENSELLALLIMMLLLPHTEEVDRSQALQMFALSGCIPTDRPEHNYSAFSAKHEALQEQCSKTDNIKLSNQWLKYYMSENSKEAKFVRGCRDLAMILKNNVKPEDSAQLLEKIHSYCETSAIMENIFNVQETNN